MKPESKARVELFLTAYQRGWTLQQIGQAAGVTRQCVQQLIARYEQE
jgi:hypothetical protein